jgi:uncharacterized membrane protein
MDSSPCMSIEHIAAINDRSLMTSSPNPSSAVDENVQTIKQWEQAILLGRSKAERVSDWIAGTAGSGPVLIFHVVWFGVWVIATSA